MPRPPPCVGRAPQQRQNTIDFDKLEAARKRLGIEGDRQRWPSEFDDPAFSRRVLGLDGG